MFRSILFWRSFKWILDCKEMRQNLTKIINLFFGAQGTSLNRGVGAVLGFKESDK